MKKLEQEQGDSARAGTPAWARVTVAAALLLLCAGAVALVADYRSVEPIAPHVFSTTLTWRVGTPGTYYIWTDHEQRLQSTREPSHVPTWTRSMLEIWHPDWGPRPGPEGGYIVDVRGQEPGDLLEAKLQSRAYIWAASHAGDAGDATGHLTAFFAEEIAASHPESLRMRAAEQALVQVKALEARRPPTQAELLELYKTKIARMRSMRQKDARKSE